jgi:hypothetical protein
MLLLLAQARTDPSKWLALVLPMLIFLAVGLYFIWSDSRSRTKRDDD